MRTCICILCIILLCSAITYAQPDKKTIAALEDTLQRFMKNKHIPGASVTITVKGKTVFSKGYGYADLEQQVPVNPQTTKFRIGSISKALTAVGLAKLYEQKRIFLDSSVYFYLSTYPQAKYRFTVRQLAGHIAGIRHYKGNEFLISKHYETVTEALTIFSHDSLLYRPGTAFQYSSHGFNLLSAIIEKASGKDFLTFMRQEVFIPLTLKNTCPDLTDSIIPNRTRFYQWKNNHWENAPYVDNSYKWAGGGFISSSEDIARFANIMLSQTFLRKETINLITTPQKLTNQTLTTYGIGFFTSKDQQGNTWFGHSGGSVGGTTDMVIYPASQIVVVVLTNLSSTRLTNLAQHLAQLVETK